MTQRDLDRAVARATGETEEHVRHMGFTLTVVPAHPRRRPPAPTRRSPAASHRERSVVVGAAARGSFQSKRGEA